MRMYDIIEKKRDGKVLTEEEVRFFIEEYTNNRVPDYQVSALLMAIYLQQMNDSECVHLTNAMVDSGDIIDLSQIDGVKVDKHSTGGVGDTTTLVLAPLVASLGIPVAKMSGRGLGHTGGTLDKLESIPGFHIELTNDDFIRTVNQNKVAVIGQTGNLTPADKKLYSLRDVTATVNSIPLIASSIMSKKIASGADAIVLDVKIGSGAFMKEMNDAVQLAKTMVAIGKKTGRNTMAVISDMNQPLGCAIGNALEVKEAIDTLQGKGPKDLTELCLTLGSQMVVVAGKAKTVEEARTRLEENIANGKAFQTFQTFIAAQGGDINAIDNPEKLPQASYQIELLAKSSGTVVQMDANAIGTAAMHLGAGRVTKETEIDLSVGLILHKKIGDQVKEGETLLTIHSNDRQVDYVKDILYNSIIIEDSQVEPPPLIHQLITI